MDDRAEFERLLSLLRREPDLRGFSEDELWDCANAGAGTEFKRPVPIVYPQVSRFARIPCSCGKAMHPNPEDRTLRCVCGNVITERSYMEHRLNIPRTPMPSAGQRYHA